MRKLHAAIKRFLHDLADYPVVEGLEPDEATRQKVDEVMKTLRPYLSAHIRRCLRALK